MLKDRDFSFSNRWVQNTIRILEVVSQNAPDACLAKDIAKIVEIPILEVEEILINLCIFE